MAATAQNTNNRTIRSILLAEKLTGSNFTNWYHNLRIVLKYEKKMKFVEQPIGPAPDLETADPNTIDKYYETVNLEQEVARLVLYVSRPTKDVGKEEGQSVSSYLLKMKSYLDTLECLGYAMPNKLGMIAELHAMLKLHEKGIPKKAETPAILAIREGKIQKDKRKPRGAKGLYLTPLQGGGDWRRNCPSYQAELKKRKEAGMASTSGIFTIELYAFPNKTWVYDTGYGTHICNTLQGLRRNKKLKHGALSLYMGNGICTAVEAIRSFDLILPSGLIIVLDNCHFTPIVTRGVVSISHMQNLYLNDSSTFNVSNKRVKYSLDSSYLWHCSLGHINKKRMDKLQHDGILHPTHDESLKKCKSCIFGKMTHKPFLHKVERAKDLLGLIHNDVCGPFRTVSREGASYFITFIDVFSRDGYIYLKKHKHEVFVTFKVFQSEVENQLNIKIKAIRSDRGGEYLSHEFVNHMKSCGYPKETMGYYFYYPPENKIFVAQNAEFFENNLIVQEASGSHGPLKMSGSDEGLELIKEEDTQPSENTSEEHNEVVPMEYELGDLNEPPNYKAALSDPEYDKWLEAMNTEMQSMKDT
ncbi:retrotransposon protein, putative, ty1-copia subclass [Tanacetum coccineum]